MLKTNLTLLLIYWVLCSFQKGPTQTEIKNNYVYVIHKVLPGETMYGLSKKYQCTLKQTLETNPSLNNTKGIKPGQILSFPLMKNGKHLKASVAKQVVNGVLNKRKSETAKLKTDSKKEPVKEKTQNGKYHIVKENDTIYSLSKFYKIPIAEFSKSNEIFENKLTIGQKLLVDRNEIMKNIKPNEKEEAVVANFEKSKKGKKIFHEGIAEVVNTKKRTNKYLALHRYAPVGSMIKVTNEANGKSILAKVVGNLNKIGKDQETLLKLSPYAYYQLNPNDSKIRAKVEYFSVI